MELNTTTLEQIAEITMGQSPDSMYLNHSEIGLPFLQGCAEFGRQHPVPTTFCDPPLRVAQAHSILVSVRAPVGTLNWADQRYCIGRGLAAIKGRVNIADTGFISFVLQNDSTFLHRRSQGSTFLAIGGQDLAKFPVPSFSFQHQQKIAYILQTIDQAIEKTEQLIEKYQQIKAGLMHDLFTRGIGTDGKLRPTREQSPELYQETPIGWIPKDWKVKTIDSLSAGYKGSTAIGPFGSDLVMTDYRNEGVPVVFVRDVKESGFKWVSDVYVSTEKAQSLNAHKVKPGDLLATKMGLPPCVACVYPSSMNDAIITADMIKMTPNTSEVDVYWLASALNNDRVRRQVAAITAGVTRPKITLADFRMLQIATPSLGEQRNIKKFIEAQEKLTELELQRLIVLRNQKSGLMHDLLTGKVPVSVDPLKAPLSLEQGAA